MAVAAAALSMGAALAGAATDDISVPSRIITSIDLKDTVTLTGNTHPFAKPAADQGLVPGEQHFDRLFITLRRSPTQERALARFNARQLDRASSDFHHWLQPREFGLKYGPNDADLTAVTNWLETAGFQIDKMSDGRIAIEFSGSVAQVERAFGVQMHRYLLRGVVSIANDRDPQIPRALSPIVAGIVGLNTFPLSGVAPPGITSQAAQSAQAAAPGSSAAPKTTGIEPTPQLSIKNASENFAFVTPYDFATIYNSLPLWTASTPILGTGVTIAIIGDYDVNLKDISTFRSTFGLPPNAPTVQYVPAGTNPSGKSADDTVALEMAGAAAPGANLTLVLPAGGKTLSSLLSAITYVVDQNLAPIVNFGFQDCELLLGTSNNTMLNSLWQQGSTQGMSIVVAAGDSGSAGCNAPTGSVDAGGGLAVNGFASSPFVTAVGATDFAWQWGNNSFSTYWGAPPTAAPYASANGYIPEVPWNVTCTNVLLFQNQGYLFEDVGAPSYPYSDSQDLCNAQQDSEYYTPLLWTTGGGGGYSHCTTLDSSGDCQAGSGYAKPAWQRTAGVPADGKRDVPDVSIFASKGWPNYAGIVSIPEPIIPGTAVAMCYTGSGDTCTYASYGVGSNSIGNQASGGTLAAAAYWAGILALVEQKQGGQRLGLVNPTLYSLYNGENLSQCNSSVVAAGNSCIFYDVSAPVTNGMTCKQGSSPDCIVLPTQIDDFTVYGILDAYTAGVGYDQTTGLGSVNIANLVNAWSAASSSPPAPASSVAMGAIVDYLGDGRSDFSVWRPSSGNFYTSDQQGYSSVKQWGLATDVPVVGDFDGDGVTDFAVWRPSNGTWYITQSSNGQVIAKQWGLSTDVPVVGDFDGDGKTDIAVWRPATGTWYILQSSNGLVVTRQWGISTDTPVVGDFDGDGKTDVAVWRPATGTWYILQSSNGSVLTKQFGISTDVPVFGDFDGDGKTDIAVWRSATGMWYIIDSSTGQTTAQQWGQSGDVPVPSDYGGTGKTNIAVWRPSSGDWFVYRGVAQESLVQQWGAPTDLAMEQQSER